MVVKRKFLFDLCSGLWYGSPMYQLTDEQANLIKDILWATTANDELNAQLAKACGMSEDAFDTICNAVFIALGNGRVTIAS